MKGKICIAMLLVSIIAIGAVAARRFIAAGGGDPVNPSSYAVEPDIEIPVNPSSKTAYLQLFGDYTVADQFKFLVYIRTAGSGQPNCGADPADRWFNQAKSNSPDALYSADISSPTTTTGGAEATTKPVYTDYNAWICVQSWVGSVSSAQWLVVGPIQVRSSGYWDYYSRLSGIQSTAEAQPQVSWSLSSSASQLDFAALKFDSGIVHCKDAARVTKNPAVGSPYRFSPAEMNLQTGTYKMCVRATNGSGENSGWHVSPAFTANPVNQPTITLISPSDTQVFSWKAADAKNLNFSWNTTGTNLTNTYFWLQQGTISSCTGGADQGTNPTSKVINLVSEFSGINWNQSGTRSFSWCVWVRDALGQTATSVIREFTVQVDGPPSISSLTPAGIIIPRSLGDTAHNVNFSWTASDVETGNPSIEVRLKPAASMGSVTCRDATGYVSKTLLNNQRPLIVDLMAEFPSLNWSRVGDLNFSWCAIAVDGQGQTAEAAPVGFTIRTDSSAAPFVQAVPNPNYLYLPIARITGYDTAVVDGFKIGVYKSGGAINSCSGATGLISKNSESTPPTLHEISLTSGNFGTYHICVQGLDLDGNPITQWTETATYYYSSNTPAGLPTNLTVYPENSGTDSNPRFTWTSATAAAKYQIAVLNSFNKTCAAAQSSDYLVTPFPNAGQTAYELSLTTAGQYRFCVISINAQDEISPFGWASIDYDFSFAPARNPVKLWYSTRISSVQPEFGWYRGDENDGTMDYFAQLMKPGKPPCGSANDVLRSSGWVNKSIYTYIPFQGADQLTVTGAYRFCVKARNAALNESDWSYTDGFEVRPGPTSLNPDGISTGGLSGKTGVPLVNWWWDAPFDPPSEGPDSLTLKINAGGDNCSGSGLFSATLQGNATSYNMSMSDFILPDAGVYTFCIRAIKNGRPEVVWKNTNYTYVKDPANPWPIHVDPASPAYPMGITFSWDIPKYVSTYDRRIIGKGTSLSCEGPNVLYEDSVSGQLTNFVIDGNVQAQMFQRMIGKFTPVELIGDYVFCIRSVSELNDKTSWAATGGAPFTIRQAGDYFMWISPGTYCGLGAGNCEVLQDTYVDIYIDQKTGECGGRSSNPAFSFIHVPVTAPAFRVGPLQVNTDYCIYYNTQAVTISTDDEDTSAPLFGAPSGRPGEAGNDYRLWWDSSSNEELRVSYDVYAKPVKGASACTVSLFDTAVDKPLTTVVDAPAKFSERGSVVRKIEVILKPLATGQRYCFWVVGTDAKNKSNANVPPWYGSTISNVAVFVSSMGVKDTFDPPKRLLSDRRKMEISFALFHRYVDQGVSARMNDQVIGNCNALEFKARSMTDFAKVDATDYEVEQPLALSDHEKNPIMNRLVWNTAPYIQVGVDDVQIRLCVIDSNGGISRAESPLQVVAASISGIAQSGSLSTGGAGCGAIQSRSVTDDLIVFLMLQLLIGGWIIVWRFLVQ